MKRVKFFVLAIAMGWSTVVFAANGGPSIALNFGAGEPNGAEEALVEGAAGVAGTQNWNNLFGAEAFGDEEIFLDVGGSEVASDVSVEWISNNTWSSDGRGNEDTNDAPEGNDRALMLGYLDTSATSITEITVGGIPDDLAAGYDVFLYVQNGVLNRGGTYTVTAGGSSQEQENVTVAPFDGAYVGGEEGNYLLFEGMSGSELIIEAMATNQDLFRGPVNAVEICAAGKCTALPNAVAGRGTIGTAPVGGNRSNLVFGEATDEGPGLAQEWFGVANPGTKDAIDEVFNNNDPVVAAFRSSSGTWWTGSDAPFGDLEKYPVELDPPLENNYSVRLTGEINIEESGTYRFADGVDDFTYLAIDTDKSGVAGDSDDEVLINDNTWTNALRSANGGGGGHAEVDIDVAEGGEWIAIEVNVAEGGGGDSGVMYWDYDTEGAAGSRIGGGDGFPEFPEDEVFEEDAGALVIPDSHLRSSTRPLLSGDISGTIPASPGGWEFEVNPADGSSDVFSLDNPDSNIFTTSLDVDGASFIINASGEVAEGTSFKIIEADNITGTPDIFPADWTFNAANGTITFGAGVAGDFNGNGMRDVEDLDLLAGAMGGNDAKFDLNGDGNVNFADRQMWVVDLANTFIGDANFDGEFNSSDFVTVFGAAKYEKEGVAATWAEGDWNGDGVFTSSDFVAAFGGGGYESGPRDGGLQTVPEPSSFALILFAICGLVRTVRRK